MPMQKVSERIVSIGSKERHDGFLAKVQMAWQLQVFLLNFFVQIVNVFLVPRMEYIREGAFKAYA